MAAGGGGGWLEAAKIGRGCVLVVGVALFLGGSANGTPENPHIFQADSLPTLEDGSVNLRLLPSVGNGHVATNVWADAIYVNGIYNGRMGLSHRARIQALHASEFSISACTDPQRTYSLDTRQGVVSELVDCDRVQVLYRTMAHAVLDRVLVTEVHITRDDDFDDVVVVERQSLAGDESASFDWEPVQEVDGYFYKYGTTREPETDGGPLTIVNVFFDAMPDSYEIATSGQESHVYLMAIDVDVITALDQFLQARDLVSSDPSGDSLRAGHLDAWADTWRSGSVVLEGASAPTALLETTYAAQYYIFSSLPTAMRAANEPFSFFGLSPGGLANGKNGSDYYGHVFWDMETWMYPPVAVLRPDLAKSMLNYRISNIDDARLRAQEGGYEGARFPWESAFSGVEVTPDICIPCRENQQHITGDIALAARTLVALTRDGDWLNGVEGGNVAPVDFILEMGRFWESRPTFNDTKGLWEINGVMPPDEHQESVRNSIFTNTVANYAVSTARWAACLAFDAATAEDLVPEDSLDKMADLVFPFQAESRYHEEFEGFHQQLVDGTFDPRGIKQADVALLGFPLLWSMPDDVRRNDLLLYDNITHPEGPAMTWSMYAVGWLELGELEKAQELFLRSYEAYVREPFRIWTEVRDGVGAVNFITGAGGFLQALIFGFAGLRVRPYALEFVDMAVLPTDVDAIVINGIDYLGAQLDVTVAADEITVTMVTEAAAQTLELQYEDGATVALQEGVTYTFPRQNFQIHSQVLPDCDPPRDVFNNVDYTTNKK